MMTEVTFRGERYRDDRMFVLHCCKCTVAELPEGAVETTIYHEEAPPDHGWCVATYRNTGRCPIYRVDPFESASGARRHIEGVEPQTPLVSLGGRSPIVPLSYPQFVAWKNDNGLKDYDYAAMYTPGGSNAREIIICQRR